MVQLLKYLLIVCVASLFMSCSSTRELPVKTIFPFAHDDAQYEIISINSPEGEGMNFLTKVDGDSTVLKCLDMDQDGVLEIIQYGSLDVDEANLIYNIGILKAMEAGKFRNREGFRTFEFIANDTSYTIDTFGNYIDQVYNRFSIVPTSSNKTSIIFLDIDANGTLDQLKSGKMDLQRAQRKYESILQAGVENAQIHRRNEKFIVIFKTSPPSS